VFETTAVMFCCFLFIFLKNILHMDCWHICLQESHEAGSCWYYCWWYLASN